MNKAATVDEYIASAPKEVQGKLREIRKAIKEVAPATEEKMSYGMPYYGYKGRLAYFAYTKNHIGFYVIPPTIEHHQEELKKYETSTATIRFPLDQELPITLIKKLVKVGVQRNEARHKKS